MSKEVALFSKKTISKIAIFDLDGTLYFENSHMKIIQQYYTLGFVLIIILRVIAYLFPVVHMMLLNILYDGIDIKYKSNFLLPFRPEIIAILKQKKEEGFVPIIVSNAPFELVRSAALQLGIDFLQAPIGNKAKVFLGRYFSEDIFVCTDNYTDKDILDMADNRVILVSEKTRKMFSEYVGRALFINK